jgi:hypothetical protein
MPVGELESEMSGLANHILSSEAERWGREEEGAYLFSFYLLPDPENPATLELRETHAASKLGDAGSGNLNSDGETELRAVLAMRRSVQGEDHPETLNTRLLIAQNIFRQDRLADAEAECREVLAHYERVPALARERPPRELMATVLSRAEKFADAEPLRRWLLEDAARRHGAESKEAAEDHYDLAACLMAQHKNEEAALQAREAISLFKKAGRSSYRERSAEGLLKILKERGVP